MAYGDTSINSLTEYVSTGNRVTMERWIEGRCEQRRFYSRSFVLSSMFRLPQPSIHRILNGTAQMRLAMIALRLLSSAAFHSNFVRSTNMISRSAIDAILTRSRARRLYRITGMNRSKDRNEYSYAYFGGIRILAMNSRTFGTGFDNMAWNVDRLKYIWFQFNILNYLENVIFIRISMIV